MGNFLSKPKRQPAQKNWREAENSWWRFRAIYGNLGEEALARRFASEMNSNTDTTVERMVERMRQNGLG